MNAATPLGQGLFITIVGMGLVFAVLALLWGIVALLLRLAPDDTTPPADGQPAPAVVPSAEAAALTDERAQVAAMVAGALLASALPLYLEPPAGPTFEHGRTAPIWVTANRSRTLQSWQPPRQDGG